MATMRTNPNRLMTLLLVLELVMVAHGQTHASTFCNRAGLPLIISEILVPDGLCSIIQVAHILTIVLTTGPSSNPNIPFPKDVSLTQILSSDGCLILLVLGVTPGSTLTQILSVLNLLCILGPTPPGHNSLTGHGYASLPGSLTGHEEYANLKGSLTGQEIYASLEGVAGM